MATTAERASLVHVFGREFLSRYDVRERVGKGFYAKVHRCVDRGTGQVLAVKSIDVRPLRLRENFSRQRLMREVDILQRLAHPSIIRLVEATWNKPEGGDHLLLVMEFAPGQELFDMIITKGKFSERDGREIVAQLVSALAYCHARDIVHRDVKPENILLVSKDKLGGDNALGGAPPSSYSNPPGAVAAMPGGKFIVKLLDFGLSRTVGSSGARTFAGTPEYFAPEVDPRRRTGGAMGSYGVAADCWSLGAVIFVMLSGVFPEFSGEGANRHISFARPEYWGHISAAAKDLIARLMHPDPNKRITMDSAAAHPWLKDLMGTVAPRPGRSPPSMSTTTSAQAHDADGDVAMEGRSGADVGSDEKTSVPTTPPTKQMESCRISPVESSEASGAETNRQGGTKRVRVPSQGEPTQHSANPGTVGTVSSGVGGDISSNNNNSGTAVGDLADVRLGADAIAFLETDHLFLLQNQLATLFHDAYITYARENDSHMTQTIRMHAVECRQLFKSSAALMNKLGGTASNVIEVLPDLRLGVEENEPELAELFFTRIRGWIKELKEESRQMMDKNSAAIRSLNISMENAKQGLFETVSRGAASLPGRSKNKMLCSVVHGTSPMIEELRPRGDSLFPQDGGRGAGAGAGGNRGSGTLAETTTSGCTIECTTGEDNKDAIMDVDAASATTPVRKSSTSLSVDTSELTALASVTASNGTNHNGALVLTPPRSPAGTRKHVGAVAVTDGWKKRVRHLQQALAKLTQVDRILGGFSMFWDHMETSVSLLSQRNEHVESLLSFTKNPKLRQRFFDRLDEYANMWLAVQMASRKYNSSERSDDPSRRRGHGGTGAGIPEKTDRTSRMYGNFLNGTQSRLQLTNSSNDDGMNQHAEAAAANLASRGFQPVQEPGEQQGHPDSQHSIEGVNSGDVAMKIVHEESL